MKRNIKVLQDTAFRVKDYPSREVFDDVSLYNTNVLNTTRHTLYTKDILRS